MLLALVLLAALALSIYLARERWASGSNSNPKTSSVSPTDPLNPASMATDFSEHSKTPPGSVVVTTPIPTGKATSDLAQDVAGGLVFFEQETNKRSEETAPFSRAMAAGMVALEKRNFEAARAAFGQAKRTNPNSPAGRDGLVQAENGLLGDQIRALREEARVLEENESWGEATHKYKAILALDPHIAFAKQALEQAAAFEKIHDSLKFYINLPERMSAAAVLEEARALTDQIDLLPQPGPKLTDRGQRLKSLVKAYETPVRVLFESDNETQVMVAKIGKLGTFEQRVLNLRPGKYVVMGSRRGFRDVRHQLIIKPGQTPNSPIRIRCEEEI